MTTKSFGDNGDKFVSDLEYLGTDNMRSLKSIKNILTKMQEKIVKIDSQYKTLKRMEHLLNNSMQCTRTMCLTKLILSNM